MCKLFSNSKVWLEVAHRAQQAAIVIRKAHCIGAARHVASYRFSKFNNDNRACRADDNNHGTLVWQLGRELLNINIYIARGIRKIISNAYKRLKLSQNIYFLLQYTQH